MKSRADKTGKTKQYATKAVGLGSRLLLVSFFAGSIGFSQQFQVDGNMFFNSWQSNGKPAQEESLKFSLSVSNCFWKLVMTPTNKGGPDYYMLTYDGTQLYMFEDIETAVKEAVLKAKARGDKLPDEMNYADGIVVNSEVPHMFDVDGAGQIWLSYASACKFKSIATNRLEVPWAWVNNHPIRVNEAVTRRAYWTIQRGFPQLPLNISYLTASEDFTNAFYQVSSYTNYQDLVLPLESDFEVFNRVGGTTNIYLMFRYAVKAAAFKPIKKGFDFPPRVPVLTTISDCRFSDTAQLPYNVSDRFLTKEEARHTPYYASAILHRNVPITQIRGKGGKLLVWAVMSGITIIFLTLVIRKRLS